MEKKQSINKILGIKLLKLEYKSTPNKRLPIINSIINSITTNKISVALKSNELFLILDEAITNAMEHGNKWNSNKKITVKVLSDNEYLYVDIGDQGNGFNSFSPEKKEKSTPGGRGIKIIKYFSDPIWNEKGNRITLRISIAN